MPLQWLSDLYPSVRSSGQCTVMADGKALQIPQALAATQDARHRHRQQLPGRKAHSAPHSPIRNRPAIADQIKIGCRRGSFVQGRGTTQPIETDERATARSGVTQFEAALGRAGRLLEVLVAMAVAALALASHHPGDTSPKELIIVATRSEPLQAMPEEQLKAFMEAVRADTALQEKLKEAADVDAVVAVAEVAGFVISAEELEKEIIRVSDEELQNVAGGFDFGDYASGALAGVAGLSLLSMSIIGGAIK